MTLMVRCSSETQMRRGSCDLIAYWDCPPGGPEQSLARKGHQFTYRFYVDFTPADIPHVQSFAVTVPQ